MWERAVLDKWWFKTKWVYTLRSRESILLYTKLTQTVRAKPIQLLIETVQVNHRSLMVLQNKHRGKQVSKRYSVKMNNICGVNQESEKADYRMGENTVSTNHTS